MIDTKIPGRLGPVKELIEAKKVEIMKIQTIENIIRFTG